MPGLSSRSIAAGAVAGAAAWLSWGSLDLVAGPAGDVRIAMLPSLPTLVGLVAAGAVLAATFAWVLNRRPLRGADAIGTTAAHHGETRDADDTLLPLFGLASLGLPYLPWLPDHLPVFLLFAGPARLLVWAIVFVFVARATVEALRRPRSPQAETAAPRGATGRSTLVVLLAGATVFSAAALRLTGTPVFPGGDEPHYLVIAQSLWRDGDLKIENNHTRRDYAEYFDRDLPPHYLTRGVDGEIYSIHPVGLALVLAPVYGIAGYSGVGLFLAFAAAVSAALMYRAAKRLSGSAEAAAFAWLAIALSPPFLLNSFTVYPEILAGLCVMVALTITWRASPAQTARPWLAQGLALAALPWLSTKYAPMAAAIACLSLARIWFATSASLNGRLVAGGAVLTPFAASLALWFLFFFLYWGSPLPSAPYAGYNQTSLIQLRTGLLGLLFDQEYGVVPYAPIVLVGLGGLVSMWRARGEARRCAGEITVVLLALIATVGAFRIWWGGSAAPGRPMASGLLLFGLPIAWQYGRAHEAPVRRAAYWLLAVTGIGFSVMIAVAQQGLLIANDRDGSSRLLEWLSPNWRAWAIVPSFIYHYPWTAGGFILIWLVVARIAYGLLQRAAARADAPGRAALAVIGASTAGIALVAVTVQAVLGSVMQPDVQLAGRARLRLLDSFDAARRPLAVVFDPARRVDAAGVPALTELAASPRLRRPRQAIALLYNARFSLPAGEYEVELRRASEGPAPEPLPVLSLQVGRIGPPLQLWEVTFGSNNVWRGRFSLPIDVGFVGFQGSPGLERMAPELLIHPIRIVDVHDRAPTGEVLGASSYGADTVYFHEETIWAERGGFWTRGAATVRVTIATAPGRNVTLRLRCGPIANTVLLETSSWREQLRLDAGATRDVTVPIGAAGVIPLRITNGSGFVPAEVEAGSKDTRLLGSWIELAPTARASRPN